ncbi:MAG: hypothetical protein RJQ04_04775 [Longimicrobiales bacterium]
MATTTRRYHIALAAGMTLLVFLGFWPSYFGVLVSGQGYDRHWIFHLHAAVFLGWMALLLARGHRLGAGGALVRQRAFHRRYMILATVAIGHGRGRADPPPASGPGPGVPVPLTA